MFFKICCLLTKALYNVIIWIDFLQIIKIKIGGKGIEI